MWGFLESSTSFHKTYIKDLFTKMLMNTKREHQIRNSRNDVIMLIMIGERCKRQESHLKVNFLPAIVGDVVLGVPSVVVGIIVV